MTRPTTGTAETQGGAPVGVPATAGAAWGTCRIRLVADRMPSLRAWSTDEVHRARRFAAVMQHGHPQRGAVVFTVPVDPARVATSRSRYALVQLTAPGAMPEAIGLGVGRRTAATEALA